MNESPVPAAVTIRPAVPDDADGIARTFLESAAHHASLDPDRYSVPPFDEIVTRYREGQQHAGPDAITHVAELAGEIIGFVDARLDQSPDPMHRRILYCHVVEIAVRSRFQSHGIGRQLLDAAEAWGRRQGATLASLEYLVSNTRAGAFYLERMGYSVAAIVAIKRL
jgi:ribosomal protein S18 acetylase RimI-like enzyme